MTEKELVDHEAKVKRGQQLMAELARWKETHERVRTSNAVMLAALHNGFQMATYASSGSLDWDRAKTFLGFEVPSSLEFDTRTELTALKNKLLLTIDAKIKQLRQEFESL